MLKLIKELMEHGWEFSYKEGTLYLILGNTEREIHNDEEAEQLRLELYRHWWTTGNWVDNTIRELQEKPRAEWTQDDWETYHYCQQVKFENGDYEE